MDEWLTAALNGPAVLVTVAAVEGSTPREPGAKMLVIGERLYGTIGGGHLELRAAEVARAMLGSGEARRLERFALGPSLGQCCGGVVHLAFELADTMQLTMLAERRGTDTWRLIALDGAPDSALFDTNLNPVVPGLGAPLAGTHGTAAQSQIEQTQLNLSMGPCEGGAQPRDDGVVPVFAFDRGTHLMQEQDGRRWLVDHIAPPRQRLLLFGAGHVGAAIVRALAELPCRVTWVDERDELFPAFVPANVEIEPTDTPESVVASAPVGASYLVTTHSHALDLRLSEAILSRSGVGWFGLIGSSTKRRQFEHRLRARGLDPSAMVCPIGLPGITGKAPAVIAASVAAQLLTVWEAQAAAARSLAAPCIRLVASSERT